MEPHLEGITVAILKVYNHQDTHIYLRIPMSTPSLRLLHPTEIVMQACIITSKMLLKVRLACSDKHRIVIPSIPLSSLIREYKNLVPR